MHRATAFISGSVCKRTHCWTYGFRNESNAQLSRTYQSETLYMSTCHAELLKQDEWDRENRQQRKQYLEVDWIYLQFLSC